MPCAAVDLFCGIGGLTHGLQLANINVVAGIDIDVRSKYAYEKNNNSVFVHKNVNDLTVDNLKQFYPEGFTKILVGCAPCQPFSKYSQRYRKTGHRDDKWKLLYSFSRLVKGVQPEVVSMENVPELYSESVFEDFNKELLDLGYWVSSQIVYCPDYGVPQKRKRLVLLASLLGEIALIPPLYTENTYITVRDAIGNLPEVNDGESDPYDKMHIATKLSEMNKRRIQQSLPGGTWRDWEEALRLECHKKITGRSYPSVYGRMEWDQPSPTITTQFYGLGNGRFGHPEQDRALTLREGAILQSFPPDYSFIPSESKNQPTKKELGIHIGNAVPVELGRAIGVSINNHLGEVENRGKEEIVDF